MLSDFVWNSKHVQASLERFLAFVRLSRDVRGLLGGHRRCTSLLVPARHQPATGSRVNSAELSHSLKAILAQARLAVFWGLMFAIAAKVAKVQW